MSDVFDLTGDAAHRHHGARGQCRHRQDAHHRRARRPVRRRGRGPHRRADAGHLRPRRDGRAARTRARAARRRGRRAGRPARPPARRPTRSSAISRPGRPTWSTYDGGGWRTPSRTSTRPPSPPPTASASRCSRGSGVAGGRRRRPDLHRDRVGGWWPRWSSDLYLRAYARPGSAPPPIDLRRRRSRWRNAAVGGPAGPARARRRRPGLRGRRPAPARRPRCAPRSRSASAAVG